MAELEVVVVFMSGSPLLTGPLDHVFHYKTEKTKTACLGMYFLNIFLFHKPYHVLRSLITKTFDNLR